jgi:hypothetical protein
MALFIKDNGGRRLGVDRRQFSYNSHIPERKSGKELRSGRDRRLKPRISIYKKIFKRTGSKTEGGSY